MNIVSVDWDYFFADTLEFDWGHRESLFFIEAIWSLRAGAVGLVSGEPAIDKMRPRSQFKHFWNSFDFPPEHLVIAESHLSLLEVLRQSGIQDATVYNFDAHHDLGYGMKEENCGNWAKIAHEEGRIESYKLVYPQWRFVEPEIDGSIPAPEGLEFEYFLEPPEIEYADMVFICRSGSWTPPWCDDEWMKFIGHFEQYEWLWDSKSFTELALKKRSPNMAEAKQLRAEHIALCSKMGVLPFHPKGTVSA